MKDPYVKVTEYWISCVPEDYPDAWNFTLRVHYRGRGRWAVVDGPFCLRKDGHRDIESQSSSRTDRWLEAYRFDLDTALEIARKYAPKMTVNGFTVQDILEEGEEENAKTSS